MMVALAVTTLSANAQISLKPMVGLTIANITDVTDNNAKAGLAAGLEAEFSVSPQVSITGGLLYSMQGCCIDDYETSIGGYSVGTKDAKYELDYINIPILANFYVTNGLALKVGIQPGFLVSAKDKGTTYSGNSEEDWDIDIKDNCKTFDFSIPIGISYEFSDFVIDARYNWGLTKVNKRNDNYEKDNILNNLLGISSTHNDKSNKNSVFMISLGYKFAL